MFNQLFLYFCSGDMQFDITKLILAKQCLQLYPILGTSQVIQSVSHDFYSLKKSNALQ